MKFSIKNYLPWYYLHHTAYGQSDRISSNNLIFQTLTRTRNHTCLPARDTKTRCPIRRCVAASWGNPTQYNGPVHQNVQASSLGRGGPAELCKNSEFACESNLGATVSHASRAQPLGNGRPTPPRDPKKTTLAGAGTFIYQPQGSKNKPTSWRAAEDQRPKVKDQILSRLQTPRPVVPKYQLNRTHDTEGSTQVL